MLLITGATGFIGSNLIGKLLRKGKDIRILCLPTDDPGNLAKKVEVSYGDITKPETLRNALKGVDTLIHLAGLVSYTKPKPVLYKINAVGTKNLIKQCKRVDKIIFSSSVAVYGEITGKADENYPVMPRTYYGESKYLAERIVMRSGTKSVVLRIAPAYGKGSPNWLKNLKLLEKGFPIPSTSNLTHVVHVSDFVQALVRSVDKGEGIYNIADKAPVPFTEFAETVVRALGKRPRRMPMFLVKALARMKGMKTYMEVLTMNRHYVIDKARRELGYRPRANLERELKSMVEWYREIQG